MRRGWSLIPALLTVLALTGCEPGSAIPAAAAATPRGVVDSAHAPAEALRRFRAGLPVSTRLAGGDSARDALVHRFADAVERSDTAALRTMMMSRAEFAYLYYAVSPSAEPPTRQPPDLVWFLHVQNSQKGISRVLQRFGGATFDVRGYHCAAPRRAGANTVWDDCQLRMATGAGSIERRMFGGIIERAGHYKIFSYANDF